ncbi:hypothetical protein ACGFY6_32325 [Streptomyces sp. NPDC048387]|uniref:hypothetical protein n=1 Tax=Streptomyces sp. NPDC048387 TaxID=3365542 RepID=UPI00371FBB32
MVDQPEHTGLGWDFAGEVEAAGPGVGLAAGTRAAGRVVGFDRPAPTPSRSSSPRPMRPRSPRVWT